MIKNIYNKYIDKPLSYIDEGPFFAKGFYYFFLLLTAGILLGGIGLIIFSAVNVIEMYGYMDIFPIIRSVIGSIISLIISLITIVGLALIFFKRSSDLNKESFSGGLVKYYFYTINPVLQKIFGECMAFIVLMSSIIGFFGALLNASILNPFFIVSAPIMEIAGGGSMSYYGGDFDFGAYLTMLGISLAMIFVSIVLAFLILVLTYLQIEIYIYVLNLFSNIIKFLPKFAIPLWVQKSDRNANRPTIDINDI